MSDVDGLAAWLTQVWDVREWWANSPTPRSDYDIASEKRLTLARIAADRQILELHSPDRPRATEDDDWGHRKCAGCGWQLDVADGSTLDCPTVRLLALPHADRPGYQEAWRP